MRLNIAGRCRQTCRVENCIFTLLQEKKLSEDDQLNIFYRKCKTDNSFNSLAVEFGVTPRVISSVYEHVENILFSHASENIWFLSEEENKQTMPESFKKKYPDCRGIIDCFEIKVGNNQKMLM